MYAELREHLNRELEGLTGERRARFLQRALATLDGIEPALLPLHGAGFGSAVSLTDLDSGERLSFTLMAGDAIDLDAGEISLASPVGQALLGAVAGEEVVVSTPQGRRRFRVLAVERLEARTHPEPLAAGVRVA